jgi:hypothetical protein
VQLESLTVYVLFAVYLLVLVLSVYSLIHGGMQRADAYTAAGKLTKNAWMGILGGAVLLTVLAILGFSGLDILFVSAAAVASGVYLTDVRPKLLDVQGKSR